MDISISLAIILILELASIVTVVVFFNRLPKRTLLMIFSILFSCMLVATAAVCAAYYSNYQKRFESPIDAFFHINKNASMMKEMNSAVDAVILYSTKEDYTLSFLEKNEKGWRAYHNVFGLEHIKFYHLHNNTAVYIKKFDNSNLSFVGIESAVPKNEIEKKFFTDINEVSDSHGNAYSNFKYIYKQQEFTFYYAFIPIDLSNFDVIINDIKYQIK